MFEEKEKSCSSSRELVGINVGFACFDGITAILAFSQRVAMLVILLWFYSHGVKISVSSSAISLVSVADFSRVDLCHQADDDEEEDDEQGFEEALLQNSLNRPKSSIADNCRICYPSRLIHVGSHQKIVILVTVLVFLLMMTFAVLIWIGMEDNPIDSSTVARVYIDLSAVALLLLGGALACYGLLLCRKMRNVRSERASSEIWKVAGLATVSVVCFTSSAFVALFTDIPMLYHWHELQIHGVYTSTLLILYYFIGSSVPSAFVLWVMRELPPVSKANIKEESTTVTFITDSSGEICRQQSWTAAASSQIQDGIATFDIGSQVNGTEEYGNFLFLYGFCYFASHMGYAT
ncbi:hypothetical protein V6N12_070818 [Hibiscus sabdariffa]|uniref:THH1/TOM1/TOM3 domain-containing protein n=1 Tax=Hibiscus sabdariffa TaxID=183260 RepID=A0ABR2FI93_9ROSI